MVRAWPRPTQSPACLWRSSLEPFDCPLQRIADVLDVRNEPAELCIGFVEVGHELATEVSEDVAQRGQGPAVGRVRRHYLKRIVDVANHSAQVPKPVCTWNGPE